MWRCWTTPSPRARNCRTRWTRARSRPARRSSCSMSTTSRRPASPGTGRTRQTTGQTCPPLWRGAPRARSRHCTTARLSKHSGKEIRGWRRIRSSTVDEAGRGLAESTASATCDLLAWAASLPGERSWALEDCRQLTRALERALLAAGESLVRVPPKLMAPHRRAGRARGKSDPIDALAVARAALREPRLDHPRPGERRLRELKLPVDHRDDLIDARARAQQRLRWHLHDLDPTLAVPLGALDRAVWLDRLGRRLARLEHTAQTRIARELVGRCRGLTRTILELDRELQAATTQTAPALLALPGCGAVSAAKLLGEIGPIERFDSDAQLARHAR